MKYLILSFLLLVSCSSFAQIAFINSSDKDNAKFITILFNAKEPSKSTLVYSDRKSEPYYFTVGGDVVLNGVSYGSLNHPGIKPYYILYKADFSTIELFDNQLHTFGRFDNMVLLAKNSNQQQSSLDWSALLPFLKLIL